MVSTTFDPSHNQKALWILQQQIGESWYLHNAAVVAIRGELSISDIKDAFDSIVQRHEALSMTFRERGGIIEGALHEIADRYFASFERPGARYEDLMPLIISDTKRNLRLDQDPLFHVRVFRTSPQTHIVVYWVHHIVSDARSLDVIKAELGAGWRATANPPAGDPRGRFLQFCAADAALEQNPHFARSLEYWRSRLDPKLPPTRIYRRSAAAKEPYRGGRVIHRFGQQLSRTIDTAAKASNTTVYVLLLANFLATLSKYTEDERLAIGLFALNRSRSQCKNVVGYYANPMVLQVAVRKNQSPRDFARELMSSILSMVEEEAVPFSLLVEKLRPLRVGGDNPFFGIAFDSLLWGNAGNAESAADSRVSFENLPIEHGAGTFDWLVWLSRGRDGEYLFESRFNLSIYEEWQIGQFMTSFEGFCMTAMQETESAIGAIPALSRAQRQKIVFEWNRTSEANLRPR
jgi:hypothetical protein